jgi:hypothetical protein
MPRKGHTEEQIIYALRQAEAGKKAGDICREWLCHMPRLPTIVDDHGFVAQAGPLTRQLTGISQDDLGSILNSLSVSLLRTGDAPRETLNPCQGGPAWSRDSGKWAMPREILP